MEISGDSVPMLQQVHARPWYYWLFAYAPTQCMVLARTKCEVMLSTMCIEEAAMSLRSCSAMCGTDRAYAIPTSMRCVVLTSRMVLRVVYAIRHCPSPRCYQLPMQYAVLTWRMELPATGDGEPVCGPFQQLLQSAAVYGCFAAVYGGNVTIMGAFLRCVLQRYPCAPTPLTSHARAGTDTA
eukprot:3940340-Rhodomonas_salina.5